MVPIFEQVPSLKNLSVHNFGPRNVEEMVYIFSQVGRILLFALEKSEKHFSCVLKSSRRFSAFSAQKGVNHSFGDMPENGGSMSKNLARSNKLAIFPPDSEQERRFLGYISSILLS